MYELKDDIDDIINNFIADRPSAMGPGKVYKSEELILKLDDCHLSDNLKKKFSGKGKVVSEKSEKYEQDCDIHGPWIGKAGDVCPECPQKPEGSHKKFIKHCVLHGNFQGTGPRSKCPRCKLMSQGKGLPDLKKLSPDVTLLKSPLKNPGAGDRPILAPNKLKKISTKNIDKPLKVFDKDSKFSPKGADLRIIGSCIMVDFTDYPELFKDLKEGAKECFRSPEMQVLWILDFCAKELLDKQRGEVNDEL